MVFKIHYWVYSLLSFNEFLKHKVKIGVRMPKMGLLIHKSLWFMFLMMSTVFILSWFSVLRLSTPHSLDFHILPNSNLLPMGKHGKLDEGGKCDSKNQVLKVFMYDLPPQFHFNLLGWKGNGTSVWPDIRKEVPQYAGGLNLQHSIEYWLTLDLLSSEFSKNLEGRSAVRVQNSSEADVVFVPFFSSISFNRFGRLRPRRHKSSLNCLLQSKLVQFLTAQEEWKRSGGRDHIILAHHPNSLLDARMQLWPAIYILADFGRYPRQIANVEKDVIAPYKHVVESYKDDVSTFDSRPTLLYFQGAVYRKDGGYIRQELYYLLRDEKDVHFDFGTVQRGGVNQATQGMRSSKFCLNIAGDTPSSNRLFDAIASHCVPVIISDEIELPYEDVLDYSEFSIFIRTSDALKEKFIINLIRNITEEEWMRMWRKLKEVEKFYEFQYPSRKDDAVQMIWQAISRKLPSVKRKVHREGRYLRTANAAEYGVQALPVPRNFGQ